MSPKSENGEMRPAAEFRPPDARTIMRDGGIPAHLVILYHCIDGARSNMAVAKPHQSEVTQDRMQANDLDRALEVLLGIASVWGVELPLSEELEWKCLDVLA